MKAEEGTCFHSQDALADRMYNLTSLVLAYLDQTNFRMPEYIPFKKILQGENHKNVS